MKIINLILLSFVLVFTAGCGDKGEDNKTSANSTSVAPSLLRKVVKPFSAPDLEVTDIDGKKHKLSDYRGKPVLLNFWATWCPPCRAELPSMNRAWAKVKADGIIMLAANVGEPKKRVEYFLKDNSIDFKVLLDEKTEFAPEWHVNGMPTTFIVNPDGLVVYKVVGTREWDNEQILVELRALKK
jgi:peroxiredoxin